MSGDGGRGSRPGGVRTQLEPVANAFFNTDYVFALRDGDQPVWIEHEQHICGLFPRAEWVRLLHETGFEPEIVRDPFGRDLFVARRS